MFNFKHFAVVSDIHGNLPALEVVTADLKKRAISSVINLGDHLSGPLWPLETARFLMQQNWMQIAGNHDRWLVNRPPEEHGLSDGYAYRNLGETELAWLKSLPAELHLENGAFLFHGAPGSMSTYLLESISNGRLTLASPLEISSRLADTAAPLLLCGHTHKARVVQLAGGALVVNPGSVGLPAYSDNTPVEHVSESGSPHTRYAVLEENEQGWSVELITLMYDYQAAAAQARCNERPDWELGLLTGFMR